MLEKSQHCSLKWNRKHGERVLQLNERARKALEEFGLTDYEIRAYSALVEHGALTANRVSEFANVPYSKIYDVLGNLEKKGWVETEHSRPSRYFPKSPSEALTITRLRMENALKTNESTILEELQPLYDKKEVKEKPDIWIVRGEFNILARIRDTFARTQKEALIAVPLLPRQVFEILYPFLVNLREKGARVMIMATRSVSRDLVSKLRGVAEVKVKEKMFGGGVICDSTEVLLILGEEGQEESALAIWSEHVGLAKFAKGYFEFLWKSTEGKSGVS